LRGRRRGASFLFETAGEEKREKKRVVGRDVSTAKPGCGVQRRTERVVDPEKSRKSCGRKAEEGCELRGAKPQTVSVL